MRCSGSSFDLSNVYDKTKVLGHLGSSDHCIIDRISKVQLTNKSKTKKIVTRPIKDSSL